MKELLRKFDIQLFAENVENTQENDNENQENYSKEEYQKIVDELSKFKKANDNLSKENADYKRKAKEKLSEEEKKAQLEKEKDEALSNAQKELLGIKMSKELLIGGFDEKTTNNLIESYSSGDGVQFAKDLSICIRTLIENVRKEEQTKYQQNGKQPINGTNVNGLDPIVERYINNRNK